MEDSEQDAARLTNPDSLIQAQPTSTSALSRSRTALSGEDIRQDAVLPILIDKVNKDLNASDLQISLLISALKSYKRDSVLRPFPPGCLSKPNDDGISEKNFDQLHFLTESIPNVEKIPIPDSNSCKWYSLTSETVKLLLWILDNKNYTIKSVDKRKFNEIKELTGQTLNTAAPTHIFEVEPSSELNIKFENERRGRDLIYAYHGSRIENFHSILRNGLCNHLNKNSLFGQGTYLSSELSVCMPYCQTGQGWDNSRLGDRLSCVAVCEIITDNKVKCHTRQKSKVRRVEGEAGEVPEKYYIVQNDELLRVRYLLVYAERSLANRFRLGSNSPQSNTQLISWISQHRIALLMLSYFVILLAIGFGGSNFKLKWLRKYFS